MTPNLIQLLQDVADFTGIAPPAWLAEDAPILAKPEPFYLVGLIGGKEVGKSALVNALVGHPITAQTSFGPGTETVIAYAHASQTSGLRKMLEAEVPGCYQIVEHTVAALTRQVLLDLPDIDSHWGDHVTITRTMLRHMLFPVWVQSVEKYADRQPQELLERVAAGNSPENFVFCLNKMDQITNESQISDLRFELQEDYAARLQRVLKLPNPPRVWGIAATHPDRFDLPALRDLLTQQKSEQVLQASRASATAAQKASTMAWLDKQDLRGRAERIKRMEEEADELVDDRLGTPLLEGVLTKLLDDPSYRYAIIDECLTQQITHWPIMNILHPLFMGVGAFFRRNAEEKSRALTMPTGEARIDQQLADLTQDGSTSHSLAERVQTTFALLQQTDPALSGLYRDRKLWEAVPATEAAGKLRSSLVTTINRQRAAVCARGKAPGSLASLWRGLLTIGAVLWFPFLQPIVHTIHLNLTTSEHRSIAGALVDVLSLQNFLQSLTGLLLYFLVLWIALRWITQRRVLRQFARWKRADGEEDLNLARRIVDWLEWLGEPIRSARERVEGLVKRIEALR